MSLMRLWQNHRMFTPLFEISRPLLHIGTRLLGNFLRLLIGSDVHSHVYKATRRSTSLRGQFTSSNKLCKIFAVESGRITRWPFSCWCRWHSVRIWGDGKCTAIFCSCCRPNVFHLSRLCLWPEPLPCIWSHRKICLGLPQVLE